MLSIVLTSWVGAFFALARHKDGAVEGLDRFPHVPGPARFQNTFTDGTCVQVTIDDYSFGIGIFTMGTMAWPFLHFSSLVVFGIKVVYYPYH